MKIVYVSNVYLCLLIDLYTVVLYDCGLLDY